MQKLEFKGGLLYTDIKLIHDGKSIIVNNVIIKLVERWLYCEVDRS